MSKLSQQVYDYISDTSNYDMEDILERITSDIHKLKLKNGNQISLDECGIYWGNGNDYGEKGNTKWIPDGKYIPNKYNPENKTWGEILKQYDIDGINFVLL